MKAPAVYMLASGQNGTLYIGVTSDLIKRVWQHRESLADGFTKEYDVKMLVWYEQHETMESAISKEKAMKKWLRKWKLETIEKANPDWHDLWPEITGAVPQTIVPALSVVPANAGTQQSKNALDLIDPLDSRLPPAFARVTGNKGSLDSAQ